MDDHMTSSENFYSITTKDNVTVLFTKGNEQNAAMTIMELAAGYRNIAGRAQTVHHSNWR